MAQKLLTSSHAGRARRRQGGYSLVEALIVVAIGLILTTFAVVRVQSALRTYTVNSTANSLARLTGVIRYQALTQGTNVCTLFLNNQFGIDPNCDGAFGPNDNRVQIPNGVTFSVTTPGGVTATGMPFSPLPIPIGGGCATAAMAFNSRGNKTALCGVATTGAQTHVFFLTGWNNNSAVTITGTGRARSWQFINNAWQP